MSIDSKQNRQFLREFKFTRLFVERLGWDNYPANELTVTVDSREYRLKPVAEKAGFAVFECSPGPEGEIPDRQVRLKIQNNVRKLVFEHLIIFVDVARTQQLWQWVKRESGKSPIPRLYPFSAGKTGKQLLQRLDSLIITLEREAKGIRITDVASLVSKAFDVEKVTKRFYERFRTELTAFQEFIHGIADTVDRDWYASLMLNRMMFIYFIQKQHFLDKDSDYLRNRLKQVRQQPGSDRFQQFYRIFLLRLFHEGLGRPEAERDPKLVELIGTVPFLNGGLFDVHALERDNPDINIPDEAFERLFNFFDEYRWHLDERPHREDNEINPDVLGYIFEKYVNQKEKYASQKKMGAYYTKEDITGYISRNTVIPFLFDAAKKKCPVAFIPGGGVWQLLRDDPDRYIYPAVGHGITWNAQDSEAPELLDTPLELPGNIEAGISDVSKRGDWNRPADEEYALPTETWREVVTRRQRYKEIRAKLASSEITEINDLITLNLDIEKFANDVITQSEGPELLRAFWHAMRDISVLDPTCGSGAFLFAALNILEPLYTACLEGMRGFIADLERSERSRGGGKALNDFRTILEQVDKHSSERYFTLKSIVLNNLYGVDIMEEAVEICKLRLFLKLVAQLESYDQIEPLPDIDFNIRAGNALVGFTSLDAVRQAMTITPKAGNTGQYRALDEEQRESLERIEERADIASRAFDRFREQQTKLGGKVTTSDKVNLRRRLKELDDELNYYLATEYGVNTQDTNAYLDWRTRHKPFHWFVEFYSVIKKGGFDVVLGNPPYVKYTKVQGDYTIKNYETESCGNLYAFVTECSISLMKQSGRFGFITPISITAAQSMAVLQEYLFMNNSVIWLSNFAVRPAALFPGVVQRNTICITQRGKAGTAYTTDYMAWYSEERSALFHKLRYLGMQGLRQNHSLPKVNILAGHTSLSKLLSKTSPWSSPRQFKGNNLIYYHRTGGYWVKAFTFRPYYRSLTNTNNVHTAWSEIRMPSIELAKLYCALINSTLFYFFWKSLSDARAISISDIAMFPVDLDDVSQSVRELSPLVDDLMENFQRNSKRIIYGNAEVDQYDVLPSKPIIDKIDFVLAKHYGFTDEELDFIINYDIKYRMGSGK